MIFFSHASKSLYPCDWLVVPTLKPFGEADCSSDKRTFEACEFVTQKNQNYYIAMKVGVELAF